MKDGKGKYRIKLVLEGYEEEAFFDVVKELGVSSDIDLSYINAKGFGGVAPIYQDLINNEEIGAVLAVYDVDYRYNETSSPFSTVHNQLKSILGSEKSVKAASLCTNPNILQLFLLGCDPLSIVSLTKTSKSQNTEMVNRYWPEIGKKHENEKGQKAKNRYGAIAWQLKIIADSFRYEKYLYKNLLNNAMELPMDYRLDTPGSNLPPFLMALENGDISFFEGLRALIMEDENEVEDKSC